jgi:hypothetical protein
MDRRGNQGSGMFEKLARYAIGLNPRVRMSKIGAHPALVLDEDPFAAYADDSLALRLTGEPYHKAQQLEGACLWDPTGNPNIPPQSEWVLLPPEQAGRWLPFIDEAIAYAYARGQAIS